MRWKQQPREVFYCFCLETLYHNLHISIRYKQIFLDEDEEGSLKEYCDANIFAICLVPLRLIAENEDGVEIIWNNDYPSSVSLCRPKKMIFQKENAQLTCQEVNQINEEIRMLQPTSIANLSVSAKMVFCMNDTKVINDVTGTNSQACYICRRSGKSLNFPILQTDEDDPEKYKFGISPLHAMIRSMELLLKVSYRLHMEKPSWRVSKKNQDVKKREMTIRTALKEQLGLRIGEPLPGGGNSNDGNCARRFFKNYKTVSRITELNEDILERFSVILMLINSKVEISVPAYQAYAEETRTRFVQLYGWYALSPTVHKLLVHGAALIKHALLPIGMFSEEAQESRNKSIRKYREHHSRKFNRLVNMEDVFKRLLVSSDPLISLSNRQPLNTSELQLPDGAAQLVLAR